jgi:hypothetical protein
MLVRCVVSQKEGANKGQKNVRLRRNLVKQNSAKFSTHFVREANVKRSTVCSLQIVTETISTVDRF